MTQEEKSLQSKEKILRAAIQEFGEKGYAGASLNTLLADNGLSKGLVYHYFKNKDQIYLSSVSACFDMLMASLSQMERKKGESAMELLHAYFETRSRFFQEHPMLERVFFDAMLQPPPHLKQELVQARSDFDTFSRSLFQSVLGRLRLREGVTEADGFYYFDLIQNALHLQFCSEAGSYEKRVSKTMELLLYGLAGGEQS